MDSRFKSYAEWFKARRSALSRHGLWLEGHEPGRLDPAGFETARLRILICRLSPYEDVLASITHRILLHAAQSVPGVYADLAFFPNEQDAALMQKDGVPFWLATGCKRAPTDFDIVAISLSVQQEALHLPAALQESGLRLDFAGRMADAQHPLVILGGHGAGSVPFVHGDANGPGSGGLVDAACLGDGIFWLQEFLRQWLQEKEAGRSKTEFLNSLARELPGTYVPAFYRHVVQENRLAAIEPLLPDIPMPVTFRQDPMEIWLKEYDGAYIPFSEEEIEETLPLAAGCAYRCRFCQTGWMRSEFSSAARDSLLAAAPRFKAAMVNSDLNLLASDACSVSGLETILDALCPLFQHVSVKSLSVSSLVRRPESFRLLRKLAKPEFTFGVEGISARFRAYLGKPAAAADLIQIAASLAACGLRQMKLFFIVTGQEEDRDVAELETLLKKIHAKVPGCRVIASFMPLFHAPFTPLQFAPVRALSKDLEYILSAGVRHAGGEFRWSAFPDEIALMNRLCGAGRGATPAIVQFSTQKGLRYYRSLNPDLIRELALALPIHSGEKNLHSVFPWSELQASVDSATLWKSYQKACQELHAAPELVPAGRATPRSLPAPPASIKASEPEGLSFWAWVRPEQAHHPEHVIARDIFRNLFVRWPAGVPAYLGSPRLLHPPGTSGLVLASAEFKPGTRIPAQSLPLDQADFPETPDESWLFGVHWAGNEPSQMILKSLKQDRVKFQTIRHGTSRWHIVERPFRGRTGLTALRETDEQTMLYCHRNPPLLKKGLSTSATAGVTQVILAKENSTCPICKGAVYQVLHASDADVPPTCFDCLTRPIRN